MTLLKSIIWIFSINGLFSAIFKRKTHEVCLLSFAFCYAICFVFGSFGNLRLGYYFSWFVSFVFYCYVVYIYSCKKDEYCALIKLIINKEAIVLLILFVYAYLLMKNHEYTKWDEFLIWGKRIREMYRHNNFSGTGGLFSYGLMNSFTTSLGAFWCFFRGDFVEGISRVPHVTLFLFIVASAILSGDEKNNSSLIRTFLLGILAIVFGAYVPNYGDYSVYGTLQGESISYCYGAYILYYLYKSKNYNTFFYFKLFVMIASVTLIDNIGIVIAASSLAYLITILIINSERTRDIFKRKVIPIIFISIILISFIFSSGRASALLNMNSISKYLLYFKNKNDYPYIIIIKFIKALYSLGVSSGIISMPAMVATPLFIAMIFVYVKDCGKKKYLPLIAVLFLGSALNIAATFVFELHLIGIEITPYYLELPSFDRYVGSYLFLLESLLLFLMVDNFSTKKPSHIVVAIVSSLLFINPLGLKDLVPLKTYKFELSDKEEVLSNDFSKCENGKRILVIDQWIGTLTVEMNHLNYTLSGRDISATWKHFGEPSYEGQNGYNINVEGYLKELSNYDYIYLYSLDNPYIEEYWEKTVADGCYLQNNGLYEIKDINKNKVNLVLLNP